MVRSLKKVGVFVQHQFGWISVVSASCSRKIQILTVAVRVNLSFRAKGGRIGNWKLSRQPHSDDFYIGPCSEVGTMIDAKHAHGSRESP